MASHKGLTLEEVNREEEELHTALAISASMYGVDKPKANQIQPVGLGQAPPSDLALYHGSFEEPPSAFHYQRPTVPKPNPPPPQPLPRHQPIQQVVHGHPQFSTFQRPNTFGGGLIINVNPQPSAMMMKMPQNQGAFALQPQNYPSTASNCNSCAVISVTVAIVLLVVVSIILVKIFVAWE